MSTSPPGLKSVLSPAAFLIRGLAAGLVAGIFAFVVAFAVGEPQIDDAIALEEAAAAHLRPTRARPRTPRTPNQA